MDEASEVAMQRLAASEHLIERLSVADDPVLAYRIGLLAQRSSESEARALQARIPSSPTARALLRIFEQDEKTLHHVYRKWQGPHWTLTCPALDSTGRRPEGGGPGAFPTAYGTCATTP